MVNLIPQTSAHNLIIIPTHNHPLTLPFAVRSVLLQSISDFEIVIIGDGVGENTKMIALSLCKEDGRIHYYDRPKSVSRNELARHEVITSSKAINITYLGDDDLFLPNHLEVINIALQESDFVHPYPVFGHADQSLFVLPTDISQQRFREWHQQPNCNTISLTGASHTAEMYRKLPIGWQEAPPNCWSDHYMWGQIFAQDWVKTRTLFTSTTIKVPNAEFAELSEADRVTSIKKWFNQLQDSTFIARWQSLFNAALYQFSAVAYVEKIQMINQHNEMISQVQKLENQLQDIRVELASIKSQLETSESHSQVIQIKLATTASQLQSTQSQLTLANQTIIAMESSKFWKMRRLWMKFKSSILFVKSAN